MQNLPYLKPEFNFSKNPQLVLKEINQLKTKLLIEREEFAKFQEKSTEYSLKQVEEIKKRDQKIVELQEKLIQSTNHQESQ
ncbi:MAG: hypothetical protein MRERV_58c009 [Mycoplasmataceae bacterium RV_VA103A]|nr:MAG: hypothetical protein MRERV_58c009 [Mycoplasmataceae bacterium RV_VA103A]